MNIMLENTDNQRYFIIKTILRTFLSTLIVSFFSHVITQAFIFFLSEKVLYLDQTNNSPFFGDKKTNRTVICPDLVDRNFCPCKSYVSLSTK